MTAEPTQPVEIFYSYSYSHEDERLRKQMAKLYRARKYSDAKPLFLRALAIREKTLPPNHLDTVTYLENYASLLREMQRTAEAAQLEARSKAIRAKSSS